MSMNQTNSYTQYTHEILTFLLSGMDVFAYDNAGKGLSEGSNSEFGLLEAICLSGLYLKQVGYDESRIVFKGQCAGGIPTSAAPTFFPRSHVWIDQSPNSFAKVSTEIFKKMIEEKKDQSKLLNFFYRSLPLVEPIVSSLTKFLFPSIDIIENAARGSGLFIYSIGVPDQQQQGGDTLVPKEDVDAMIAKLGTLDKEVVFLPIVGGSHVTDWWCDPKLIEKVSRALKKQGLIHSNFGAV